MRHYAKAAGRKTGAGGGSVNVPSGTYSDYELSPTNANCTFTFSSAGTYSNAGNGGGSGTWRLSGASADYEIRWTTTSGALSSGTAGTWQSLSTSRSFGVTMNSIGTNSCTGTVEIRMAASPFTVLDSGTITLQATKDA